MNDNQIITREYFSKRLIDLCLRSGLSGYPNDIRDQHILFKSAILSMSLSGVLTEKEINEKLRNWIENISRIKNIDHGTLRRRLVDMGYLIRNKDGSCYQISPSGPGQQLFEKSIDEIDIPEVIQSGRDEIARRKREYLEKINHLE